MLKQNLQDINSYTCESPVRLRYVDEHKDQPVEEWCPLKLESLTEDAMLHCPGCMTSFVCRALEVWLVSFDTPI